MLQPSGPVMIGIYVASVLVAVVSVAVIWSVAKRVRRGRRAALSAKISRSDCAIVAPCSPAARDVHAGIEADAGLVCSYERLKIRSVDDLVEERPECTVIATTTIHLEEPATGYTELDTDSIESSEEPVATIVPSEVLTCLFYHGALSARAAEQRLEMARSLLVPGTGVGIYLLRWAPGLVMSFTDETSVRECLVRCSFLILSCLCK